MNKFRTLIHGIKRRKNSLEIKPRHVRCFKRLCESESDRKNIVITLGENERKDEIDTSIELMRTVHTLPGTHSFEIYNKKQTQFLFSIEERSVDRFQTLLHGWFPNFKSEIMGRAIPKITTNDFVSTSKLFLTSDNRLEILNPLGPDPMSHDPYEEIVHESEKTPSETRILIQIAYESVEQNHHDSSECEVKRDVASGFNSLFDKDILTRSPKKYTSSLDDLTKNFCGNEKVAARLQSQKEEPIYTANIRLMAISQSRSTAISTMRRISQTLENGYDDKQMGQGLRYKPVLNIGIPFHINKIIKCSVGTDWESLKNLGQQSTTLTVPEIASLVHFPSTTERGQFSFESESIKYHSSSDC